MIVTDFHSHILPSVDDGSSSTDMSMEMLRMEAEQGIRHVIATPHFYPQHDSPDRFLERRERAMDRLGEAMGAYDGLPEITLGAEVYYFRGMSESDQLPRLTIGEKKCILVEMPHAPWTEDMYKELEAIWTQRGILPIIAHVDRYIRPLRTYGIPERLSDLPVLVQANAEFFLNKRTAGMALRMLKADRIHLLGSDCHNITTRKPNLGDALDCIHRKLGEPTLQRIETYQRNVLGRELTHNPGLKE